jgi:hypothetical protein
MISPGTEASGSSLPSTAHSISRALATPDSMTIFLSNRSATSIASWKLSSFFAFEMPTLDPRFAGLTKTG